MDYSRANFAELDRSPARKGELSDSDTDFQAKAVESEGEEDEGEGEGEGGEGVTIEELRSPQKQRKSRGIAAPDASPEGKGTKILNSALSSPFEAYH